MIFLVGYIWLFGKIANIKAGRTEVNLLSVPSIVSKKYPARGKSRKGREDLQLDAARAAHEARRV